MTAWTSHRIGAARPGIGVTVHRLAAPEPGPRLLVLGGVHGNEIGGIVAAGALTRRCIPLTHGTMEVVPIVHEAANDKFLRRGPADDLDLARTFPGDQHGSPTQRLAAIVAAELISAADALIDLHTSSPDADLPFFAGSLDDGSPAGSRGMQMAAAFGAGTVWSHPALGAGRTLTVAAERGIPAIYVESPTGGVLHDQFLTDYGDGVLRVCGLLGMVPAETVPDGHPTTVRLQGSGDTDSFSSAVCDGYFAAEVELLQQVTRGQRLGRLVDAYGAELGSVEATDSGLVSFLRREAKVSRGTPLASVSHAHPADRSSAAHGQPRGGDET